MLSRSHCHVQPGWSALALPRISGECLPGIVETRLLGLTGIYPSVYHYYGCTVSPAHLTTGRIELEALTEISHKVAADHRRGIYVELQ